MFVLKPKSRQNGCQLHSSAAFPTSPDLPSLLLPAVPEKRWRGVSSARVWEVGCCDRGAVSLGQFLPSVLLRVGVLYPPPRGPTPEECGGALRPTSDGRYKNSPNFIWGKCGETLWTRNSGQVFFPWQKASPRCMGSVQPCLKVSSSPFILHEGLSRPTAFLRGCKERSHAWRVLMSVLFLCRMGRLLQKKAEILHPR